MWILSILISISLILLLHVDDFVYPYLVLSDIVVNDVVRLTIVVGDLSGLRRLHHNVTELIVSYGLWRCTITYVMFSRINACFIQVDFLFLIDPDAHALKVVLEMLEPRKKV